MRTKCRRLLITNMCMYITLSIPIEYILTYIPNFYLCCIFLCSINLHLIVLRYWYSDTYAASNEILRGTTGGWVAKPFINTQITFRDTSFDALFRPSCCWCLKLNAVRSIGTFRHVRPTAARFEWSIIILTICARDYFRIEFCKYFFRPVPT